jgi:hypothetical protein
MSKLDQRVGKICNHAFGASIGHWRNALEERRHLSDAHQQVSNDGVMWGISASRDPEDG